MIKKVVFLALISLGLSSCVSKKVYQELEGKYNNLHASNLELLKEKDDLVASKAKLLTDFEQLKAQLNSISDAPAASSLDKINQPTTPAAFVINDESSKPVLEPLKESKLNLGDFDATTVIKTIKTPEQFSSVFVNKTMNPVSTPITDISEPDLPKLSDSVEPVKVLEQSPVIDSKEQRNFTNIETEEYTLK